MSIELHETKAAYGVSIGEAEIKGFLFGRSACGLDELLGLWVTFDKTSGHLIDLRVRGRCDHAQLDVAALNSLVEWMRRHAEAKLNLPDPGDDWRVDWQQYRARAAKRARRGSDRSRLKGVASQHETEQGTERSNRSRNHRRGLPGLD